MERQSGKKVKQFRTDGGGEYTSKKFASYLKQEGILKETTTPYTLQLNGVVERANSTIFEHVRCMLDDAGLSKKYWTFAVEAAVYLENRMPTRSVIGETPYKAWHGKRPSMEHLRVFGCLAFVHIPKEKRKKLDYRATLGIFVGYSISNQQYLVYDPLAKALHRSRDVIFREDRRYTAPNAADDAILSDRFFRDVIVPEESKEESKKQIDIPQPVASTPPINRQAGEAGSGRHNSHQTSKNIAEDNGHEEDDETPPPPVDKSKKTTWTGELAGLDHESILGDSWEPPAGTRRTRSSCIRLQESSQLAPDNEEYDDYLAPIFAAACISDSSATDSIIDPKSLKAALESSHSDEWDKAMREELSAIEQNEVFGDLMELPEGRKAIPSHWVYKVKCDGAGNVQRFKARLVCGGNHQVEGIDYQATYAPTAHLGHVRLALAIAAKYDLDIHQMDVCTAFLGVDLEEEIYMHLPQGYFRLSNTERSTKKLVLRLRKSLYGLK